MSKTPLIVDSCYRNRNVKYSLREISNVLISPQSRRNFRRLDQQRKQLHPRSLGPEKYPWFFWSIWVLLYDEPFWENWSERNFEASCYSNGSFWIFRSSCVENRHTDFRNPQPSYKGTNSWQATLLFVLVCRLSFSDCFSPCAMKIRHPLGFIIYSFKNRNINIKQKSTKRHLVNFTGRPQGSQWDIWSLDSKQYNIIF